MNTIDEPATLTASSTDSARTQPPRAGFSALARTVIRAGAVLGGILTLIVSGGVAYEGFAGSRDAATYPPAGILVDVGGYRLHIDCRGTGGPVVVMDAGLGGASLDWALVQPRLAGNGRVCTYDRAGMGWSDPGAGMRNPAQLAEELHTLLTNAEVSGPYILVGHSLAGKTIRLFAAAYPSEVAGMVLVDTRSERIDAAATPADVESFEANLASQALTYSAARRIGLARVFGGLLVDEPLVPPEIATQMALLQTTPSAIAETVAEGLARSADDASLAGITLGSMPLVVIAAEASMSNIAGWPDAQRALAGLSSEGQLVVAAHSRHPVQLELPGLVVDAIAQVRSTVRETRPRL